MFYKYFKLCIPKLFMYISPIFSRMLPSRTASSGHRGDVKVLQLEQVQYYLYGRVQHYGGDAGTTGVAK